MRHHSSEMIDVVNFLKSVLNSEKVNTDNNVFKLHYKMTVGLLIAFSLLLTSKQYFGEPINCDAESRKELINNFCWIYGTFINKETLEDPNVPGLGNIVDNLNSMHKQNYYQWVCIAFGIQAAFFYIPRYLWKSWEGGRMKLLVQDLGRPLISPSWNSQTKDNLIRYLLNGGYSHNVYAVRYCFCEILNFINVVFQIYFMDWFISGNFSNYGLLHASYKIVNPMNTVFPKVVKCTYFNFGPSGSLQNHDALCVLSLNILNEKVFLTLWYWLFMLLVVSFGVLAYRGLFLFMPNFRVYLLRAQIRHFDSSKARIIVNKLSFGDFFVLYRIGKNVNPLVYKEICSDIFENLTSKYSYKNFSQDLNEV